MAHGTAITAAEPSQPALFGTGSIYREPAAALAVSESQELKEKLANQLYYDTPAQAGKFFGYTGTGSAGWTPGFATLVAWNAASTPLYIVPRSTPRVKVWLVEAGGAEETPRAAGANSNLQSFFETVPMPDPRRIPLRSIPAAGSDRQAVCWCPHTGEMWGMWRLSTFKEGAHAGEWKFTFGEYYPSVAASSGIPANGWGVSGSGLCTLGGNITIRDLVGVLRGKPIGHALGVSVVAASNEHRAPATRNNPRENTVEKVTGTETPNPAHGNVDAVPMGLWCRFPPASRAEEYGITKATEPLAWAIFEAVREYGLFVRDGSGACNFYINDPRTLGTPYAETKINPFAGIKNPHAGNTAEQVQEYVNRNLPLGWGADPTLPALNEELHGTTSVLAKMPWRTLEQLAARTS